MPEVVLQMIPMVLQCVESLVLNLPACSTSANQLTYIPFIHLKISYPTVAIGPVPFGVKYLKLNIVHYLTTQIPIQRYIIHPFIKIAFALLISMLMPGQISPTP